MTSGSYQGGTLYIEASHDWKSVTSIRYEGFEKKSLYNRMRGNSSGEVKAFWQTAGHGIDAEYAISNYSNESKIDIRQCGEGSLKVQGSLQFYGSTETDINVHTSITISGDLSYKAKHPTFPKTEVQEWLDTKINTRFGKGLGNNTHGGGHSNEKPAEVFFYMFIGSSRKLDNDIGNTYSLHNITIRFFNIKFSLNGNLKGAWTAKLGYSSKSGFEYKDAPVKIGFKLSHDSNLTK